MKIVITGTSSGIGLGLARHLAAAGHEVIGLSRRGLTEPVPGNFQAIRCDVTDVSRLSAVAKDIARADALICVAGVRGVVGPAMELAPEEWMDSVRQNLAAAFFPIRVFGPLLSPAQARRKIICFSGGGATKARPRFSAYAVAKTGVVRLVETLAAEWSGQAVDINAVAPGALPTAMMEEILQAGPERAGAEEYEQARKVLAGGGASLAKVTGLVDFLLSPASDGITGRLISAPWDDWAALAGRAADLKDKEWYQLRRVTPEGS